MSSEGARVSVEGAEPRSNSESGLPDVPSAENSEVDSNALVRATAAKIQAQITSLRPEQASQAALIGVSAAAEMYSGPLPHPRHFKQFNDTLPGSGDRILSMAEREQRHRHRQENLVNFYPFVGLATGGVAFILCIAGAVWLFMTGHPGGGGALLGLPVLGTIGWFVNGRIGGKTSASTNASPEPRGSAKPKPQRRRK